MVAFVFYYPLVMSLAWMIGAVMFWSRRERRFDAGPPVASWPLVSILVPCFNEEDTIGETLDYLQQLTYPSYEIIVINDGSTDGTVDRLKTLEASTQNIRVINLTQNRGKANALKMGLIAARGEFLVTVDSDAILNPDAVQHLIRHFIVEGGERVGAVTGNPRVRNRSSLLAKIQLVEYSSIIGLIKRSQRILGKIMTVSGVVVAFRKAALVDCGTWDVDIITDDIGVSWKLQRRFWDIRYEPRAICWMLVPETLKGLWRQRVRWAQGGFEVLWRHKSVWLDWKQRRLVPIWFEEFTSLLWAVAWFGTTVRLLGQMVRTGHVWIPIYRDGTILAFLSLLQALLALGLDHAYDDQGLYRYYLWAIWYPAVYWMVNAVVMLWAVPKAVRAALRRRSRQYAVWQSPDRGLSA